MQPQATGNDDRGQVIYQLFKGVKNSQDIERAVDSIVDDKVNRAAFAIFAKTHPSLIEHSRLFREVQLKIAKEEGTPIKHRKLSAEQIPQERDTSVEQSSRSRSGTIDEIILCNPRALRMYFDSEHCNFDEDYKLLLDYKEADLIDFIDVKLIQDEFKKRKDQIKWVNEKKRSLTDLHLTKDGLKNLLKSHGQDLKYLDMSDLGITNAEEELRIIKNCPNLEELELVSEFLSINNEYLLELAKLKKLTKLNLSDNEIGDEEAKHIAAVLPNLEKLTNLRLSDNEIGDAGAIDIAEALKTLKDLKELDLSANQIGLDGVTGLAKVFEKLVELTDLDLCLNMIGDEGAKILQNALLNLKKLKKLNLSDCNISDEGVKALAEGLKTLTNLQELNLSENKISEAAKEHLKSALPKIKIDFWGE